MSAVVELQIQPFLKTFSSKIEKDISKNIETY